VKAQAARGQLDPSAGALDHVPLAGTFALP
jgi:hypothetical protein